MGWPDGWDTTTPPRRPRRPTSPPDPDARHFVSTVVLTTTGATDPEVVNRAREKLAHEIQKLVDRLGYTVTESRWGGSPPDLATGTIQMRLEATGVPRTDGEWPAIRQALQEDEEDRRAAVVTDLTRAPLAELATAAKSSATAMKAVGDRLDALGQAMAVWSASTTRSATAALRGPSTRSSPGA